jgi:uncharacterized protein (DUF58 family)
MLASSTSSPVRTLEDLLPPTLAARLDRLDLLSRKIISGKLPGERRSKRRGQSVEFDDYRPYVPGDDPRHIDWNVLARLDRLVVKLFREETDLALTIAVDASASMDTGEPGKLVYAHRLALALAYVGLVNQNRVTVMCFGGPARDGDGTLMLAPLRGRRNLRLASDFLLESLSSRPGSGSARAGREVFATAMRRLALSRAGGGITVVISDFLWEGGAEVGLSFLMGRGEGGGAFDTYAVQTLAPGELRPEGERERGLHGDLSLADVETGRQVEVTISPASLAEYRAGLAQHQAALLRACRSRGIALSTVETSTPVETLILGTLRQGGMLR